MHVTSIQSLCIHYKITGPLLAWIIYSNFLLFIYLYIFFLIIKTHITTGNVLLLKCSHVLQYYNYAACNALKLTQYSYNVKLTRIVSPLPPTDFYPYNYIIVVTRYFVLYTVLHCYQGLMICEASEVWLVICYLYLI